MSVFEVYQVTRNGHQQLITCFAQVLGQVTTAQDLLASLRVTVHLGTLAPELADSLLVTATLLSQSGQRVTTPRYYYPATARRRGGTAGTVIFAFQPWADEHPSLFVRDIGVYKIKFEVYCGSEDGDAYPGSDSENEEPRMDKLFETVVPGVAIVPPWSVNASR